MTWIPSSSRSQRLTAIGPEYDLTSILTEMEERVEILSKGSSV